MTAQTATMPYSASIEEAVRLTGLSKTKLYALLAEGKVQGKKRGRRTLVMMDGVRAYIDALPQAIWKCYLVRHLAHQFMADILVQGHLSRALRVALA